MLSLDHAQLTGRARTHVIELSEPACTLHPAAARAFLALRAAAARARIEVLPLSAFRDFERQRLIWNEKFAGLRPLLDRDSRPLDPARMPAERIVEAILHWSALPGASRHHWGTEIDVIDGHGLARGERPQLLRADYAGGGRYARLDAWLTAEAAAFGFYRPYDRDRGGVQPEPWHLSYAPVAGPAGQALTLEILRAALEGAELSGHEVVMMRLPQIHARFVRAVAAPDAVALAAADPP